MDRAPHRFDFVSEVSHERPCDKDGCGGEGLYRAPKSNRQLNDYHWFCLDHVREYNKAWNFCAGMSEKEIEAMVRRDTTWERDTRPMSAWIAHEERLHRAAADFAGYTHHTESAARPKPREPDTPEAAALRLLGLTPPVDYAAIRARYIELVKINHPDANGGDKDAEERLKAINQALMVLKAAYLT